jgi:hypothetical protein
MKKRPSFAAPSDSPEQGLYFRPVNASYEATKSAGISAAIGTGIGYLFFRGVDWYQNRTWSFRPSGAEVGWLATAGAILGALSGFDILKKARIVNSRTALLNKYKDQPAIQADIFSQIGPPEAYQYQRGTIEKITNTLTSAGFYSYLGWGLVRGDLLGNDNLSRFLASTTMLSFIGNKFAHFSGLGHARQSNRMELGFVEKLALQNAGTRAVNDARMEIAAQR